MTYSNNTLTRAKLATIPDPVQIMAASQLPRHPIGVNARQDSDWGKLLAYVKQQGGLRSLLLHVDSGALSRARDFLPHVSVLVWRDRETADESLRTKAPNPEQWMDRRIADIRAAGLTLNDVWIHLHNEAGWSAALIEWERRAILHAVNKGAKVVALNCAVGTPEPANIVMARPIIELAAAHRDSVIIGLHEYMSVYGTRTAPWYLNRWDFWEFYRKQAGIGPVRYLITEFGTEDISDDHPYTDKLPRTGGRKHVGPVHANDAAWQATYNDAAHHNSPKPYPGIDRAYYEQIVTAYSLGDYESACIEAVLLFSWGHDNGRWSDYDIQGMTALHDLLAGWDKREKEPMVTTPPPVEVGFKPGKLKRESNVRERKGRAADNPVIELLPVGWAVEYQELDQQPFADGYYWIEIMTTLKNGTPQRGWIALTGSDPSVANQIEPTPDSVPEEPEPPQEPETPTETDPDDTQENPSVKLATEDYVDQKIEDSTEYTAAKFEAMLAKMDAQARRIEALERVLRGFGVHIDNELKLVG